MEALISKTAKTSKKDSESLFDKEVEDEEGEEEDGENDEEVVGQYFVHQICHVLCSDTHSCCEICFRIVRRQRR